MKLGKYEIQKTIGEGGFGKVYLANDENGEKVALKSLKSEFMDSEAEIARFLHESETLRGIDHENVVRVLDAGRTADSCFLVLEYVDGPDLAQFRNTTEQITVQQSMSLVASIAEALDVAHSKGIIHRDVKPSNILVDREGKPFLTDFGLALTKKGEAEETVLAGTVRYMAPEKIAGQEDNRSDIYSLGIVFYELITGNVPTSERPSVVILESGQTHFGGGPIEVPSHFVPAIPESVDDICMKCIALDKEERFQSAGELSAQLRRALSTISNEPIYVSKIQGASLVQISGERFGSRFDLATHEVVLGRHPDCDVTIEVGAVSRNHAKIVRQRSQILIEDMKSRNGTYLNGTQITKPEVLNDGDLIRICDVEFQFSVDLEDESFVLIDDASDKLDIRSAHTISDIQDVRLKIILDINRSLGSMVDLDSLLPRILDGLFKVFLQADRGFIGLWTHNGEFTHQVQKSRDGVEPSNIRISGTIVNLAVEKKQAIISLDASDDERFERADSIADFKIRSLICVPLLDSMGNALGFLQLDTLDSKRQFEADEDLPLVVGIAAQASMAIENAKLHQDLLSQQQKRLREQRDLALATVHNLRNPLMLIRGALKRSLKERSKELEENDPLSDAFRYLRRVEEIVSSILRFVKPPEARMVACPILDVLNAASVVLEQQGIDFAIRTNRELQNLTLECDPELLRQVFEELFLNAARAIEEEKSGLVTVDYESRQLDSEPKRIQISVEDNGRGIPAELGSQLFEPFVGDSPGGTGLGLSFVKYVLSEHSGHIWYQPRVPLGTRMIIELPFKRKQ